MDVLATSDGQQLSRLTLRGENYVGMALMEAAKDKAASPPAESAADEFSVFVAAGTKRIY